MKPPWLRGALIVTLLVGVQLGAILIYRAVQARRTSVASFRVEQLGGEPAPTLALERADGSAVDLAATPIAGASVRLVHFWATWCVPCLTELPGLLALARRLQPRGLELVAVAVNDDWPAIRRFFNDVVPAEVVRARDASVHKRYGVSTLPDTYLVTSAGRIVERYAGARDWASPAAATHIDDRLRGP